MSSLKISFSACEKHSRILCFSLIHYVLIGEKMGRHSRFSMNSLSSLLNGKIAIARQNINFILLT